MFPSGFVDRGKETDDAIMMAPVVEKMGQSADYANDDETKPKIKSIIHGFIITLTI